jgi:hypothetical protein
MNAENIDNVKKEIERLIGDNPYDAYEIAIGCKSTDGTYTEEKVIRFGVEQKLPLDQIPSEKLIPKTINVNGVEYKTDVYVAPVEVYTAAAIRKLDGTDTQDLIRVMAVSYCNPIGNNNIPPVVSPPVSYHRATTRPLRGGVSMAAPPPTGYVNTGTLGLMVVDSIDGKLVGLTNNHVCGNPGGSLDKCKFYADDTYSASYADFNTINMYQQSSWDSGVVNKSSDLVGFAKRQFPLSSTFINYIDAGIVNLSSSLVDTGSWNVLGSSFVSPPPFASTAEIDSITSSNLVFKSARTTGPIGPDNYSGCVVQITNTSTALYVSGYGTGVPALLFGDCLKIESTGTVVGIGGDSGSVVYAKIGGVWKVVGLFFAGNGDGSAGYACRIDRVSSLLKIGAYDSGSYSADPGTRTYVTASLAEFGGKASASFNGEIYWQVGKTEEGVLPTATPTPTPTITPTPTPTPTITPTPTPTPTSIPVTTTMKALFGYGYNGSSYQSMTNLVSNVGVVATDTTGVGAARTDLAAAGYGTDKAIFGYGSGGGGKVSTTNLVSNTGVVATDTSGVGTIRSTLAAAGYGTDKAIFGYGYSIGAVNLSITNLVSNTGVVATDTTGVGTARHFLAAAGYGTDKAIFGYGNGTGGYLSLTNLVSNAGVVANDTAGVGTGREYLAAARYGTDKAIFGYGTTASVKSMTNLVSNTGVVATDTTGVGSARYALAAAGYGSDKAIFGYGYDIGYFATTNLVSNTGVVATDTAGVGTSRMGLAASGYSLT